MRLWLVRWREDGVRQKATTPLLPGRGAAFVWLIQQRPWLLADPSEITVELWRSIAAQQ